MSFLIYYYFSQFLVEFSINKYLFLIYKLCQLNNTIFYNSSHTQKTLDENQYLMLPFQLC